MKKTILQCALFLVITFLLPYTITKIITEKITTSSIPSPNDISIQYQSDGIQKELSFNEYLTGVILADLPMDSAFESIKAQAVIARTYTLKNISILNDSELDFTLSTNTSQSYAVYTTTQIGLDYLSPDLLADHLEEDQYKSFLALVEQAVVDTQDKVITYKDRLITPLYFSSCAGTTRNASEVWDTDIKYLKSVSSSIDVESSDYMKISVSTISTTIDALNQAYQDHLLDASDYDYQVYPSLPLTESEFFDQVQVVSRDSAGYVLTISLGGIVVSGDSFANALGLNSSCLYIEDYQKTVRIICNGCGHGLGFSQYGANSLAKDGYTYTELLTYYYTNVEVQDLKKVRD